ncbi:hypothetical protein [Lignipirellula cremea]|uniref:Uncharacterized protein n=1 Tax=Lignipirellula cremea TaxID=2528010 RepID=A0A518DX40_9BACT|nr:hypothetical protein [Lignipirellula cremea]QDU96421.1 hypothetical protein Pla8534_42410 [Lignipirellula cremea]
MLNWFHRPSADEVVQAVQEQLAAACQKNLLSLTLYGEHRVARRVRVRLLIVLRELDLPALRTLSETFAGAWWRSYVSPMILSQAELHASTDVFPVTFSDMQRDYRVLSGEDVLAELIVPRSHLRWRCEQEFKNLLLRMQRAYLLQGARPRRLLPLLLASFATYRKTLRWAFSLVSSVDQEKREAAQPASAPPGLSSLRPAPTASDDAVLAQAAAAWNLDPVVLDRMADAAAGRTRPAPEAIRSLFVEFLYVVHQTAAVVDQLPDKPAMQDIQEQSP